MKTPGIFQTVTPGSDWDAPRGFWPLGDLLSDDSALTLATVYVDGGASLLKAGRRGARLRGSNGR